MAKIVRRCDGLIDQTLSSRPRTMLDLEDEASKRRKKLQVIVDRQRCATWKLGPIEVIKDLHDVVDVELVPRTPISIPAGDAFTTLTECPDDRQVLSSRSLVLVIRKKE